MKSKVRIASRTSPLALYQAHFVGNLLGCEYEIVEIATTGDVQRDKSIIELGGIGAFAKEVQVAVLSGEADLAVHSAKDLTSQTPDGLELVSVPQRGDVRDVLIGSTLEDLKEGAIIGTGAQRRRAQLSALRPDLKFGDLRGNIGTRIDKAKDFDAIVLANVALERLGRADEATQVLSVETMLPQVSQGALAIEVRIDDEENKAIAAKTNDVQAFACVTTERAFLETLGGGCSIPCAGYAQFKGNDIYMRALLSEPDGSKIIRVEKTGSDPRELGVSVANELLFEKGGNEIMERYK